MHNKPKRHLVSYGASFLVLLSWALISLFTYYLPLGQKVFPKEGVVEVIMGLFIPNLVKEGLFIWVSGVLVSLLVFYGLYWPKVIYKNKVKKAEKLVVFILSFLPELGRWGVLTAASLLAILSLPSSFFIGVLPVSLFWQIVASLTIVLASISALTYKE